MKLTVTPEKAIRFTKLSVALACSWPCTVGSRAARLNDLAWCGLFVNLFLLLVPMLWAVVEYRTDQRIVAQTVCLASAIVQVIVKMILFRIHRGRLQILTEELETFCRLASVNDRKILESYVNKVKYVHVCYTLWSYFTTVVVLSGPLFLPQTLPTYAKYPFDTDKPLLNAIVYLQQSVVGFQASSGLAMDCQVALLVWYLAARFDMLGTRLSRIRTDLELHRCIRTHCELLRYARELNQAVRSIVLTTVIVSTFGAIFGSLNIVTNQQLLTKCVYVIAVVTADLTLFIHAYAADNLMSVSEEISWSMYSSAWFELGVKTQRKIRQVILRSQRCEAIRIPGILPRLSLQYYALYLYTTFSYFTTIRFMMTED